MDATLDLRTADHFDHLVHPYLPKLFQAARRIVPTDDVAWDAVQETLLRIWVRGWLPPHPERALIHLVRRSSLHQLRCLRRRRYHEAAAAQPLEDCCVEDPLIDLDRAERLEALRSALRRIPETFRSAFERFELGGESYASIAEQLDLPVGTVRSRIHRARKLLQREVSEMAKAG